MPHATGLLHTALLVASAAHSFYPGRPGRRAPGGDERDDAEARCGVPDGGAAAGRDPEDEGSVARDGHDSALSLCGRLDRPLTGRLVF